MSDFGKGFKITLGVFAAIVVILLAMPIGCTACLAILG